MTNPVGSVFGSFCKDTGFSPTEWTLGPITKPTHDVLSNPTRPLHEILSSFGTNVFIAIKRDEVVLGRDMVPDRRLLQFMYDDLPDDIKNYVADMDNFELSFIWLHMDKARIKRYVEKRAEVDWDNTMYSSIPTLTSGVTLLALLALFSPLRVTSAFTGALVVIILSVICASYALAFEIMQKQLSARVQTAFEDILSRGDDFYSYKSTLIDLLNAHRSKSQILAIQSNGRMGSGSNFNVLERKGQFMTGSEIGHRFRIIKFLAISIRVSLLLAILFLGVSQTILNASPIPSINITIS